MTSKSTRGGILWRLFPDVRPLERERFLFFASLSGLVTLAQTVGLAGSDALFLVELGPQALPVAFILASAATVSGASAYAFVVGRARNDGLFVFLLVGAGSLIGTGGMLLDLAPKPLIYAIFCAAYVTQAVFVNLHYWTFVSDYFDTLSSKRILPYLAMSGSVGGILGGVIGLGLLSVAPTESLIVVWALCLGAAGLLVQLTRGQLKRWIPVGAESDESSAENIQGALRYLRRSPLARWLTISVVGMVLSVFLVQYLEMSIMTAAFGDKQALASFFTIYLAITNGIEILVSRSLMPALLRRFGVAQANLVHPALILLTFVGLALDPRLYVAVIARINREMMDTAFAAPIRALAYNAMPFRFRGRMRAFLGGIVFYASMSIAGLALLLAGKDLDPKLLCVIGGLAAIVYSGASLMVRREYLRSLVTELRSGRLDLTEVGSDLGEVEMTRLGEHWEGALRAQIEPPRGWLDLPLLLARNGVCEPLRRNVRHPHPLVRVACIEALAEVQADELSEILADLLGDEDDAVRLAAARAAGSIGSPSEAVIEGLRERLADSSPAVRAEAALRLGRDGHPTLEAMVRASEPDAAVEALHRLPDDLLPVARARLDDAHAGVRAAALDCFARLEIGQLPSTCALDREIEHPDLRVRCAAVRALGSRGDPESAAVIARALDDGARTVRTEAAHVLGELGETGVSAALPAVQSIRRWTADAALLAVHRTGAESSRTVLERAFRDRVREAWSEIAGLHLVPADGQLTDRFLRTALENAYERSRLLAFRALELLEDPAVVRSVVSALDYPSSRARADALEVLSNLGDRQPAHELALLLEDGPFDDKLAAVSGLSLPARLEEVVSLASLSADRWLKLAAASHRSEDQHEEIPEVARMEGLLALRRVHLFAHLSLEQLEAIGEFLSETQYLAGEVVVREGEPGDVLYLLLEGEARAFKNYGTPEQIELTTMTPAGVAYFGEIAILDRSPRSATVVITKDARLQMLDGARFKELIQQSPEISFEIFKVLTQRLRTAEERVRAQEDARVSGS